MTVQTVAHVAHPLMIDVSKLPPEKSIARLIEHAVEMGASDLFIVHNEEHVGVLVRHLGMMMPISTETTEGGRRILTHIRNMAGMDINDRRRPADGRWIYTPDDDSESVDLRISTIPTMYGEDMAMRLLVRKPRPAEPGPHRHGREPAHRLPAHDRRPQRPGADSPARPAAARPTRCTPR